MTHQLKAWTVVVAEHGDQVLLLERGEREVLPGLVTGVGGKVELLLGEGSDVAASAMREFTEETGLTEDQVVAQALHAVTTHFEEGLMKVLYFYRLRLREMVEGLLSDEGTLYWYSRQELPLEAMTAQAALILPHILTRPFDAPSLHIPLHKEDGVLKIR